MLISHARPVTRLGEMALLRVLRSDGFCWGHLTTTDGEQHDVDPPPGWDLYDLPDEEALDTLEALIQGPHPLTPAITRI